MAFIAGGVIVRHRLATGRAGCACALVEKGEFGRGASGATAGVVGPLWHLDPEDRDLFRLGMRSLELFPQWASSLTEMGVNPEFQQNGVLRLAFSEDEVEELRGFHRWQSELRMEVQWLNGAEILEREPRCSTLALAAIFSPEEGCIRGQRFCDALAHAAGRLGARLYERTEVTSLTHDGDRVTGIETTAGHIAAGQVVLAAGRQRDRRSLGRTGGRGPARRGVKGQRILLRRPGFMPSTPVRNSSVYVVPRLDGNILVASTREEGRTDETVTAEGVATLISGAVMSFPMLADAAFVGGRAGVRPATPDGRPIIGPVYGVEGLTVATGHDAVGIILSPGTAELVVNWLLDGAAEPLESFRADRFASGG